MSQVKAETVELNVADGTRMGAYTARESEPEGRRPGLLVFQEAFGVNHHIKAVTRRFAEQGYVAVAPEMFHRTAPGFEGAYNDIENAVSQAKKMTPEGMRSDITAAYDCLRNDPEVDSTRIACVGYCMGGMAAYLANATVPVKAAVSYYGGGIADRLLGLTGDLHAPTLFFWGGLDKHIPAENHRVVVDALTKAGKEFVNVEFSQADHGFFCDERPTFNPEVARQSWVLTLEFLTDSLARQ
jgi:carboxymethylenebutenolidase